MFDPLACFDPKKSGTLEGFLSWEMLERWMGEDQSPSRCQAASRELDRLLEEFAEEPEETDAELEALDELDRSLEACIRLCKGEGAEPQAPEEGEEPEEAEEPGETGEPDPWKDLRALEEAVEKALPDARRYWQEESGEDRCPGMWFDSGSLALDTQELLEIADSLSREQGLSVDMGELTVLLVLYGLTITAEIPRSLEDEEKLSFLDWAIQETGLPTEFTAERVMGSVRSQPFRYAMYDLRRQFFYWVQVLAERCGRERRRSAGTRWRSLPGSCSGGAARPFEKGRKPSGLAGGLPFRWFSQQSLAPAGMASSTMMRWSFSSPFSVWTAESSMPQLSWPIILRGGRLTMATKVLPMSSSGS